MPPVLTTVLSGGPLALLPDGTVAILSALRTPCQPRIPPVQQQPGRFGFRFPGV